MKKKLNDRHAIQIPEWLYQHLERKAVGFETPAKVLIRLLKLREPK
jgi:hypothetical protein